MPSQNKPGIAKSRYRQLRLTATHEVSGAFSVSIYAKPLNAAWNEHSCLARFRSDGVDAPLNSVEDVLTALLRIIDETMLPRAVEPPA